jgi:hypothetical protein
MWEKNMLPRVLLHVIEAAVPVQGAFQHIVSQFTIQQMPHQAIIGRYVQHLPAGEDASVVGLTAAGGVESGAIIAALPSRSP